MAHRWDGNEQRWGKRIRVNIPVQLSAEDATSTDGFMNIGELCLMIFKNLVLRVSNSKAGRGLANALNRTIGNSFLSRFRNCIERELE